MKKKFVSLVLVAAMVFSLCMPVFATTGFNQSVFDGREDVSISADDMTGEVLVTLTGDAYSSSVNFDDGRSLSIGPTIRLTDSFDYYTLNFNCLETSPVGMKSMIIKIGDNRYSFFNCSTGVLSLGNNVIFENIHFIAKRETVDFMNDLAEHCNEEIKVRINGTYATLDFSLTDEMKNKILTLYTLYNDGGGTRDANLHDITYTDSTLIYKNGKFIDGTVKEKAIDTLLHSLF